MLGFEEQLDSVKSTTYNYYYFNDEMPEAKGAKKDKTL